MDKNERILQNILRENECTPVRYLEVKKLNNDMIEQILTKDYLNYTLMKAVQCLFDSKLFYSTIANNLRNIDNTKFNWLQPGKELGAGAYGVAILANMFDKYEIIVKYTPATNDDPIVEYIVGLILNNMRIYTCGFVYTLGGFNCNSKKEKVMNDFCSKKGQPRDFICLEKVNGKTITSDYKNLKFDVFFNILIQILLSLELAQRKYRFSHFDLNTNNIIIREEPRNFSISLDDSRYNFKNSNILTMIDFGLSTLTYNGEIIQQVDYELTEHGIYPFCVQGMDVYKFLLEIYLLRLIDQEIVKFLRVIFKDFYGKRDPYNAANEAPAFLGFIRPGSVATSAAGMVTPQELLLWLRENYPGNFDLANIKIEQAKVECTYTSIYTEYSSLTGNKSQTFVSCFTDEVRRSYILTMLLQKRLENDQNPRNPEILNQIKAHIQLNYYSMVENDRSALLKFRDIEIKKYNSGVLVLLDKKAKLEELREFLNDTAFFEEIEKYVELHKLIVELGIREFDALFNEFFKSRQYIFYRDNNMIMRKERRWCQTLIDKITTDKVKETKDATKEVLLLGARTGDVKKIQKAIENGVDIVAKNLALMDAIDNNHLNAVEILVQNGANVTDNDNQALSQALTSGHFKIAQYLIDNGADVNARNYGFLEYAITTQNLDILKILVDNGADINNQDRMFLTRAVIYKEFNIIKYLVEHGADKASKEEALRYAENDDPTRYIDNEPRLKELLEN